MAFDSALRETQSRVGALFPADSLSGCPLHFGSPREEYTDATTAAALFDFSDRASIAITGADRVGFLHNFCTNDIKGLSAGQGCEAFITNVKGKVLGHVWVDVDDSTLWLDTAANSADRLLAHLERYVINEDVTIADRTKDYGELLVLGPRASEQMLTRIGADVARLSNLGHLSCGLGDISVLQTTEVCAQREDSQGNSFLVAAQGQTGRAGRIRRFDLGAIPGYVLVAPRERLGELWRRLCEGGFRPAGSEVWTALRIEAGLPLFGVDLTDDNLAQEAGRTKQAISFTKGCYLGQEPIARIDAMGHVNRELRSLRLAGQIMPAPGASVHSDVAASQTVGKVTSAAYSFGHGGPVAMGLLRSSVLKPGTQVLVETGEGTSAAMVFWLPLQAP